VCKILCVLMARDIKFFQSFFHNFFVVKLLLIRLIHCGFFLLFPQRRNVELVYMTNRPFASVPICIEKPGHVPMKVGFVLVLMILQIRFFISYC
jgi:hypothetical protein